MFSLAWPQLDHASGMHINYKTKQLVMARTRYCGGGARGHGRDDVVLVPVPRHQRNISVPVHAWLTLEGP